ncbi:MAG TPA: acetyltransferase [Vicinamibacterales bacterium]
MIKAVVLGDGGHAKVVREILQVNPEVEVCRYLAAGEDDLLPSLIKDGVTHALIAVGSTSSTAARQALFDRVTALGLEMLTATHPSAVISPSASIGAGTAIMAGVIVNAAARIGANVILNTAAIVEHDVIVGDHCHIAPGAIIGGGVTIGAGSHVGIGAVVRQGQRIGSHAVIGAGAVVVSDVPDGETVVGVPARPRSQTTRRA